MQRDMDEYIDQLLAEMPEPAHTVIRNILDESIPETVKRRLLKPLYPRKYRSLRPPPTWKDRKRATLDPLPPQKAVRTIQDYQQGNREVFEQKKRLELVFRRTPWVIGSFLGAGRWMYLPSTLWGADPREFLEGVRPQIHKKLTEEILAISGIKLQLAHKVQLQKIETRWNRRAL